MHVIIPPSPPPTRLHSIVLNYVGEKLFPSLAFPPPLLPSHLQGHKRRELGTRNETVACYVAKKSSFRKFAIY